MKISTSLKYKNDLKKLVENMGYPVFVELKDDFEGAEHFPGQQPTPMKRVYSTCLLQTVDFAFELCTTDELTTNPYVRIKTPLGDEELYSNISFSNGSYRYVCDLPFYIINKRRQCFIARMHELEEGDHVIMIEPVDVIPQRSLVLRFKDHGSYREWLDRQTTDIWSTPNQLINLVLHALMAELTSVNRRIKDKDDDVGTSPGVTIEWGSGRLELALFYVPITQRIKADEISRQEYLKAFDELRESVVVSLTELANASKNKAIVEYARSLILRDLHRVQNQFG